MSLVVLLDLLLLQLHELGKEHVTLTGHVADLLIQDDVGILKSLVLSLYNLKPIVEFAKSSLNVL